MTGFEVTTYAYDNRHDTIHLPTCPALLTETTRTVSSTEASMRLFVGSKPCDVCLPGKDRS